MHSFPYMEKIFSHMDFSVRKRKKSRLFVLITFTFAFFIYFLVDVWAPFTVNHTPSCPRGIYLHVPYTTLTRNDFVTVSCPKTYDPLVQEGTVLLKRVKGIPGDSYELKDDTMIIHNETFPIYHLKYLPQLTEGKYTLPPGYYLFLNDMPYSFDSRYMGPISQDLVLHKEILLINYDFFNALYNQWIGGKTNEEHTFNDYFGRM